MSLDYGYIFSQIDKAKKKRKRWTQADTDAYYEKHPKKPTPSIDRTNRRSTPLSESATRVRGRKRGKQVDNKPESESTNRRKRKLVGEKQIADVGTEDEGKIHRGTDRKGLKRDFNAEKDKREAKRQKKEQEDKDRRTDFSFGSQG